MHQISVLAPIFNEEDNIRLLYDRLTDTLQKITDDSYEIIFINDGSIDSSISIVKSIASYDSHIKYIDLSRNFGHQNAVFAGMELCDGEAVVIIDADLQDPPEYIEDLYNKFNEGYDVVYAKRKEREGESWHKLLTAKYFYIFINKLSDVYIPL
ncbi:MAG TPA: glycosyltransferase family 2 protein, partial [Chitinophagales bacterium]|nr:glycosyltransferase family 2 protein [Chitinophagales bacterium]